MKIAVIGAGPAGLEALRLSLHEGHTCEVFEKTGDIGGTWNYTDKTGKDEYGLQIQSSMYQGLRTNLPKELMQYEDFPYREPEQSYISHPEVMKYMIDFATTFNLRPHIKFLHYVENVAPIANGRWSIQVKKLETQQKEQKEFDAVLVCIGNVSSLSIPIIAGRENFSGSVIHSHDYRKPDPYKHKKVVVVGYGNSGQDITRFVAAVADKVVLSHRSLLGQSSKLPDGVLSKPEIQAFKEKSVIFKDGSEEDVDVVIFCTGYHIAYPFLTPECGIQVEEKWVKFLYKNIMNVGHPTMAVIGLVAPSFRFPLYGFQVRFFLAYLKGNFTVNKHEMMEDVLEHMKDVREPIARYAHELTLNQLDGYFNSLAEIAKVKKFKPVFIKLYKHIVSERRGQTKYSYKLVNDENFVEIAN
ncbi:hypothetical protein JTB14_004348 [Gonioctena quinquepunctata]|nr:hypothetical protein JTB14_004348 [Gonioctena quinquepunctata]